MERKSHTAHPMTRGRGHPPPAGTRRPSLAATSIDAPAAHPARADTSLRPWFVFLMTIAVLVLAVWIFVSYIVRVPPDVRSKMAALESRVAALTSQAAEREAALQEELERGVAAKHEALTGTIEVLRLQVEAFGEGGADPQLVAALLDDMDKVKRRLAERDPYRREHERRLDQLQALALRLDLPASTRLSSFVESVVRRLSGIAIDDALGGYERRIAASEGRLHAALRDMEELALAAIPAGVILAWYGHGPVPAGWAECDGSNGTPDLRRRFLRGGDRLGAYGRTGGHEGQVAERPHWHHASSKAGGQLPAEARIYVQGALGPGESVYAFTSYAVSQSVSPPPYVTVRFIMKLP